jgi:MoxR-like ATPase
MGSFNEDERILKKKLSELERKYKETLFSNSIQNQIEKEIKKDIKTRPEKDIYNEERRRYLQEEIKRKREAEKLREEAIEKKEQFQKSAMQNLAVKKPEFEQILIKKPDLTSKPQTQKPLAEPQIIKKPDLTSKPEREMIPVKIYRSSDVVKPSELEIKKCAESINRMKKEISKAVVGQEGIIDGLIMGLLCNAHVLVEGVPGIAKTLAIRSLGCASGCLVNRVQFTVDMLPTDIIGITSYTPKKGFEVIKGPIFTNFLIADEINRSPPKTQSALIEAMQEKQVTIGRKVFVLPSPFFVMATENPIENAGVYPLPEAQIDRFLFKLVMPYPKPEEEIEIMGSNMTIKKFEEFKLKAVVTPEELVKIQEVVKKVYLDDSIRYYILSIVMKTRDRDFKDSEYIAYGSSPRASIGLFIASKARALMQGRNFVLPEDVKDVVFSILRHRLILSYKATIKKISPDSLIQEILDSIRVV